MNAHKEQQVAPSVASWGLRIANMCYFWAKSIHCVLMLSLWMFAQMFVRGKKTICVMYDDLACILLIIFALLLPFTCIHLKWIKEFYRGGSLVLSDRMCCRGVITEAHVMKKMVLDVPRLVCQHMCNDSLAWNAYSINKNVGKEENDRGQLVVKGKKTF